MNSTNPKFYKVSDRYIDFLRTIDSKVQFTDPTRVRPYVGLILNVNDHQYFAPLSSYKRKTHDKITNLSIYKVYENNRPVAVIKFNTMIPIVQTEIEYIDFSEEQDESYKALLESEYNFIKSNQDDIREKGLKLYKSVINKSHFYKSISCDFALLESRYRDFR